MNTLDAFQVFFGVIVIVLVLLQQNESGWNSAGSNLNRTRRGAEKLMYVMTIASGLIFIILSIINFLP
ncbi:preprotein translocase subunit SecG [candidate division WWE3 bacterium RIFCSPLOWO2_01_FULL_39_13]|uniref:Protein-export membrane protein SecG n=1 Tax=candidate division WWE3 bacterium RIFCSPLOWO2_01_FULL_39_13 TaxID=1802624 RepID=A0A1F4V410_UNCKA|nr:MAG: preprotein translocase subunit SecG [candidate division WWE3 bacterium RIFCSPLOWO2_01_FULL_39_13]